jgi:hypothetical protein
MDAGAPATQDITRRRTFIAPGRHHARRQQPTRTRRCPMPGASPQTETMAITQGHYHPMLNPRL